jgi:XTP/dITP diphosphohydrolase
MRKIVIASGNKGKLTEIKQIMKGLDYEFVSMNDELGYAPEIEENGSTFYENALLKAGYIYKMCGCWTLADDSGLEVDALHGAPGVYSARFAGMASDSDQNNKKLLELMDAVPEIQRSARFRCVIVLKCGNDSILTSEGTCEGKILRVISGTGGFGYDPLFVPDGYDRSFGELSADIKNRISHRSSALSGLRQKMELLND